MRLRDKVALIIAAVTTAALVTVAPVWAEHNGGSTDNSGSGDTATTDSTSGGSSNQGTETNHDGSSGDTTDNSGSGQDGSSGDSSGGSGKSTTLASIRDQAKIELETERKDLKVHTKEQRQAACEAHQTELTKRISNYGAAAQRHLAVFDSVFAKVQAFYVSKQLNVATYDSLVAAAKDKQAAAQQAVNNLVALNVTIDCTQPDPAQTVATVNTAVSDARVALQAYRAAIKDVIVAIKGASSAAEGSN